MTVDETSQSLVDPETTAFSTLHSMSENDSCSNLPRLIMSKMVLENFKSYAGKVEIGPFHQSFTSIVGANGSGKSNVIDALLFVFGFKAKKMRQEKLSGLIHHSQNFSHLDYCIVEVHFKEIIEKDDGTVEEVSGSELVVSRRALKNNSSQYFINSSSSTYTEVTNMLRGKGIDLDHKRFLILQGEVESISQMKPKAQTEHDEGLLEYLEDIIGTSQYKDPISASLSQMETLNELRTEKLNRIKIAETDVKALEAQKKDAQDYLEDENTLVRLKNKFYQHSIWESKDRLQSLESEASEAQQMIKEYDEKLAAETDEYKKWKEQYDQLNESYMSVKKEAELSQKEYSKYERDFIQIEEKKKHLKQKKKKLEKSIEKNSFSCSESDTWLKNLQKDLEKKRSILEKYHDGLKSAEEELNNIRMELNEGKTDHVQVELEEKKLELAPWLEKINDKRSEINIKISELQLIRERLESDSKSREQVESMLDQCQENVRKKKSDLAKVQREFKSLQDSHKISSDNLKNLQDAEIGLRSAVVELAQQLETSKSSAQAASSRTELVQLLYKERDCGRIPGIYGRLCELGSIEDKYDIAISSAYAERLKWLVVDTVQTAEKCLKVLKAKNAGRASFIVLDRTENPPSRVSTPESVPRLIDLIKPSKPEFAKAFYYVVRDTLIAEDLDQANRIAFGKTRWKVVTLDGKVIDKAGTMSGGGQKVSRGALSRVAQNEVPLEDLKNIERLRDQRERELKECRLDIERLSKETREFYQLIAPMKKTLIELESEVSSLEMQINALQKTLALPKKAAATSKVDLKEMEKLSLEIENLEQQEAKLKEKASAVQVEISALQNKILDIGGDKLRRQNAKVKDLHDEVDLLQNEMSHIEEKLKSTAKSCGKTGDAIDKLKQELHQAEEELEKIESELTIKNSASDELKKMTEKAFKFLEDKKEELDELKNSMDTKSSVLNKIRSHKIEVENSAGAAIKSYQELKKRVQSWTNSISNLKLQSIVETPEDQLKLEKYGEEDFKSFKKDHIIKEITVLEEKIAEAKPNLAVLEEYRERYNEYMTRVRDLDEITKQRDSAKGTYDEFRKKRFEEFMSGFTKISMKLKEMYQMITLGGNAELELVDSLDPFSEGIMFSVMPPKKSWKNISNLSGGEKTLSSLALVFALHHFKPTPLYVMDEIDAALDFRNVSIIANYIKDRTKNAQFVIISLRNNMFELADRLVGIYKTDNTTKSITINPNAISIGAS